MQVTTTPFGGYHAIVPLLELALSQTNHQGAYLYRLDWHDSSANLTAWAGIAPPSQEPQAAVDLQHLTAVVVHDAAHSDPRFASLPEFRKHQFQGVVSIPLQDGGELVGIVNFCRSRAATLPSRELSFLLNLGTPLGALLTSVSIRRQLEKAQQLLEDRKLLERAKGVLQANLGWTEEEAYLHIRRLSRQHRTPMRDISRQVIEAAQPRLETSAANGD